MNNMMRILGTRRDKKDALRLVLGNAAAAQSDSAGALQHIRSVAANHPRSPLVWNAYARAAACSGSMRSAARYLLGMVKKHPDSVPLMVLLGNSHMMTVGSSHLSIDLFRQQDPGKKNPQTLHGPRPLLQQFSAMPLPTYCLMSWRLGLAHAPDLSALSCMTARPAWLLGCTLLRRGRCLCGNQMWSPIPQPCEA